MNFGREGLRQVAQTALALSAHDEGISAQRRSGTARVNLRRAISRTIKMCGKTWGAVEGGLGVEGEKTTRRLHRTQGGDGEGKGGDEQLKAVIRGGLG